MKGKTKHPLYKTWQNMIARCEIPGASRYKNYGARGIKVCDRWRNDFWAFVSDMGEKPSKEHSIDRIDVDGHYTPENCRWADRATQARNGQNARYIEIDGKMIHVAELSEKTGIDMKTIYWRHQQGWSLDRILDPGMQWNNKDSQAKATKAHAEKKRAQTHCKRGHPLEHPNLYIYQGKRICRECKRMHDRNTRARRKSHA